MGMVSGTGGCRCLTPQKKEEIFYEGYVLGGNP